MRKPGLVRPLLRIAGAAALGVAVRGRLAEYDERARKVVSSVRTSSLDRAVPALTDLGSTYALGAAAGVLWLFGKRRLARDVGGAGLLAWVAAQGMKPLYRRARPYDVDDVEIMVRKPAGMSYPSGHPAVAAAMATVLDPVVREPARGAIRKMPRFVAFSRVYAGVHYPTDVIGGVWLGKAIGELWLRFARG
ncbi:MAG: phosphatase PAP2 family protein [Actinomycetota bacterium]|nr:phosphatase PAP2 family protein [Actinomycetota bacterium]